MGFDLQKKNTHPYWDPFREMESLQETLNRFFDLSSFHWGGKRSDLLEHAWGPAVDIQESKDHVTIRADIPGMKKDDIKITVQENTLLIQGERKSYHEEKNQNNLRVERSYGTFARALPLPSGVEAAKAQAAYRDGVLELTLPKSEESKAKQIKVDVK